MPKPGCPLAALQAALLVSLGIDRGHGRGAHSPGAALYLCASAPSVLLLLVKHKSHQQQGNASSSNLDWPRACAETVGVWGQLGTHLLALVTLLNRCLSRTVRKEAEIIECFSNRPLSNEERWLTHTKFSFQPVTPHNKWTRISTALTNTQLSPLARCRSSKQPVLAEKRKHNMQNLPTRAWVLPAKSPLLRYTKQQVNIWKRVEAKGDPMLSALIHTASLLQSPEYLLASHSNQLKVEFLVTGTRNLQVSSSVWKDFPCTLSHLW